MRKALTELLDERVAEGALQADRQQRQVAALLEPVRVWLENEADRRPGLLKGLLAKAPVTPQGMYIWGGVGRGKSMLMDLFVQATDTKRKRRVHFHAFMQEAHHAMHAARQKGIADALAPFATQIIAEVRLLAFDEMQINDITDAMIVGRLFEMLLAGGVVIVLQDVKGLVAATGLRDVMVLVAAMGLRAVKAMGVVTGQRDHQTRSDS